MFAGIVNVPIADDAALGIAQDRKGQIELAAHPFRFLLWIYGNSEDACSRRTNGVVVLTIIRQLAEAERSPVATIKKQYHRALSCECREPLQSSARIAQLEIGSNLADVGELAGSHSVNI